MKSLIARWLGYDKRLAEVEAQRDATGELAAEYARQLIALEEQHTEAAGLLRGAHRQLNLKHSSRSAQDMILKAARLLEGQQ